jgi:hypothetical protein
MEKHKLANRLRQKLMKKKRLDKSAVEAASDDAIIEAYVYAYWDDPVLDELWEDGEAEEILRRAAKKFDRWIEQKCKEAGPLHRK